MKTKKEQIIEKLGEILEENKLEDLFPDMFLLNIIKEQSDEISDNKLRITLKDFVKKLTKEFLERDLEKEVKTEFFCSKCQKFFPLDKKIRDMCSECDEEEKNSEEWE